RSPTVPSRPRARNRCGEAPRRPSPPPSSRAARRPAASSRVSTYEGPAWPSLFRRRRGRGCGGRRRRRGGARRLARRGRIGLGVFHGLLELLLGLLDELERLGPVAAEV